MRHEFNLKDKIVHGGTASLLVETILTNAYYPATGFYVDVSGFEWVNVAVLLGTLATTVKFELKQMESLSGTPDTIEGTLMAHTVAADDDGEILLFHLETAKLNADHHFVSLQVSGAGGGDYGAIVYFLGGARHEPVTQDTTNLVVSGNAHRFVG